MTGLDSLRFADACRELGVHYRDVGRSLVFRWDRGMDGPDTLTGDRVSFHGPICCKHALRARVDELIAAEPDPIPEGPL